MYVARQARDARNEDIEILRAYAVLLVLFDHFSAITTLQNADRVHAVLNGWTGVDLFFCVSGFVIYRSISASLGYRMPAAEATRQIVVFWIRRFWRLAPAASLWVALGVPIFLTFRSQEIGHASANVAEAIASLINLENFQKYACNVWHDPAAGLYSPFWSLSLEAQFYLMLPFLLVLLRRQWLTVVMVALILVQLPLYRPANAADLTWFVRTDAIAWGVLIAQFWETGLAGLIEPRFLRHPLTRFCFTFGLIYLLGTSQVLWRLQFFVGLVAFVSVCLVWAASYDLGYISRALGGGAVLRWVGHRSFSLYVSHLIVFEATRELLQSLGVLDDTTHGRLLYLATAYVCAFVAAALTYRLVEQPLRRRGRNYARSYLERSSTLAIFDGAPVPRSVEIEAP